MGSDHHHWLSYPSIRKPVCAYSTAPILLDDIRFVQLVRNMHGQFEERSQVYDVFCATSTCGLHAPGEHVIGTENKIPMLTVVSGSEVMFYVGIPLTGFIFTDSSVSAVHACKLPA